MAEGAPLLREYTVTPYRGFESLPLRHTFGRSLLMRRTPFVLWGLFELVSQVSLKMSGFVSTKDSTERKMGEPQPRFM